MRETVLKTVEDRLSYVFQDPTLLDQALTHRSASQKNNERLEFLGDAVLSYVIADLLYQSYGDRTEGELTRMRAHLVRGDTLSAVARTLDLGAALHLGAGEEQSGGRDRSSNLENAMEAVLGALYLDGGIEPCRSVVSHWFVEHLKVCEGSIEKDPKTRLQEWAQSRREPLPEYEVEVSGVAHRQQFVATCRLSGHTFTGRGEGFSRRQAEQEAALSFLENLDE